MSNGFQLSLATATRPILKQRCRLSSPYVARGCWWPGDALLPYLRCFQSFVPPRPILAQTTQASQSAIDKTAPLEGSSTGKWRHGYSQAPALVR